MLKVFPHLRCSLLRRRVATSLLWIGCVASYIILLLQVVMYTTMTRGVASLCHPSLCRLSGRESSMSYFYFSLLFSLLFLFEVILLTITFLFMRILVAWAPPTRNSWLLNKDAAHTWAKPTPLYKAGFMRGLRPLGGCIARSAGYWRRLRLLCMHMPPSRWIEEALVTGATRILINMCICFGHSFQPILDLLPKLLSEPICGRRPHRYIFGPVHLQAWA